LRLRIMAALNAGNDSGEEFDFARLKAVTQASDGNLGSHIETLERARYVKVEHGYRGRRPRMVVRPTPQGLRA
jgi:DNA-binding MarR family transcriptional regulator